MLKKPKIIIFIVVLIAVIALIVIFKAGGDKGGAALPSPSPTISEEINAAIIEETRSENINLIQADISGESVIVGYIQPIEFEMDDMFADWAYLMAATVKNAPKNIKNVLVNCIFENGEKVQVIATTEDITSFINEEITTEEFFSKLRIKPLTEGSIIE